jgi:hypothetical protein
MTARALLVLALLLAPAALATEPAWLAERVERATWTSTAIWRPVAIARATRTPEGIRVQMMCAIETGRRVLRLRYADLDHIADRQWQSALMARIDGTDPIEIEHVDRADWQSQPLSAVVLARLRAGSFLVIERRRDPLRLQLTGMRQALDQLDSICIP